MYRSRRGKYPRRRARPSFLARRSLSKFLDRLRATSTTDWPPHLSLAYELLTRELGLSESAAQCVILRSVSAAQHCVTAQSQIITLLADYNSRLTIKNACARVSSYLKRGPALFRRLVNHQIFSVFQERATGPECIAVIFRATEVRLAKLWRHHKSSRLARKSLNLPSGAFELLGVVPRRQLERVVADFAQNTAEKYDALGVDFFTAVGGAIELPKKPLMGTEVRKARENYVKQLAGIWRKEGLKPSKALAFLNPSYRSRFHRFAELVLAAMTETKKKQGSKSSIASAMKREDYEWSISHFHIKSSA
jgi:hypothetical protein